METPIEIITKLTFFSLHLPQNIACLAQNSMISVRFWL